MNEPYSQYLFYANTSEGSTIKTLVDALCKQLCKIELNLNQNGVFSQMMNGKDKNDILYDIKLYRQNFDKYFCSTDHICIGLNSHHMQNQTYSVKKKNTVVMWITKEQPEHFWIEVIPQTNGDQRCKRGFVTIQKIQYKETPLPQHYTDPILIEPSDFHRMCKDISRTHSKKIIMDVGSDWIRFKGETREITGCDFLFGNYRSTSEEVLYSQSYDCQSLNSFVKASSMSKNRVKIYTGIFEGVHRPLKLSFCAGTLGLADIYLKSNELVEYEREFSKNNDSSDDDSEDSDDSDGYSD